MASVTLLIGQFVQGSSAAFSRLICRFFPYSLHLARRSLFNFPSGAADAEDIAQCVFWELYRDVRGQRRLAEGLSDRHTLQATLATLTRQQLRRHWPDSTRQCRDIRRTVRTADVADDTGEESFGHTCSSLRWLQEIESREILEQLLALLPDARNEAIVHLSVRGYTLPEIARELGRSVRSVQRYLAEIEIIWRQHAARR